MFPGVLLASVLHAFLICSIHATEQHPTRLSLAPLVFLAVLPPQDKMNLFTSVKQL
jgi:hypothetical protein